jgi:thioredoxin 1
MAQNIKSSEEWNELISSKELVSADFWAPWCPYCLRLKPVFESVAKEYPDIKFVKINVDQEQEISSRYGIRGIPVIKFFCEGKELDEIVGYISKDALSKEIKRVSNSTQSCLTSTSLIK